MTLLSSLTNRIFAASAALVVLAIAVAVYQVDAQVTRQSEADLRSGLNEAASLVDEFSRSQFDQFRRDGRLVADLPLLKNAVETGDAPTVAPIAQEYQRQIGADVFAAFDRSGRVLAYAASTAAARAARDDVLGGRPAGAAAWFRAYAGGILALVAVPLDPGPATPGVLVVGFSLDQATTEHIRQLSNSDIALALGHTVVTSTLGPSAAPTLASVLDRQGVFTLSLGGDDYVATVRSLQVQGAAGPAPVALVLRSRAEHRRLLGALRRDVALTGLVAVLLATLLAYVVATSVTRPLRALTATMGEMAATGDLARRVPAPGRWDDEDARLLSATFGRLTAALDRFQREAAQRERLSSLGRLSTVVAHEVRNPLMIIKTTLRSLRRTPTPETVQAAASSIDEEVTRLNRVVSDVLDFAKPIPVQRAAARLSETCLAAAHAARAGADDVPIEVEADEAGVVVTDHDRVRTVLVNLLANAQAAVRARYPNGGAPAVRLSAIHAGGGWRIDVSDGGVGIAPEDLPRVFEPFFTTRQAGSGLGLAISRNIVEALGGTIAVDSAVDRGTTVHVRLPDAPVTAGAVP